MSTLHVLHTATWPDALHAALGPEDTLLLAGAAVTLALRTDRPLPAGTLALRADVAARGLEARWPGHIACIDTADWVAAVVRHHRSVAWS